MATTQGLDGTGKQPCRLCQRRSIAGLVKGQGLCPYHWAVGNWGHAWADQCFPHYTPTQKGDQS